MDARHQRYYDSAEAAVAAAVAHERAGHAAAAIQRYEAAAEDFIAGMRHDRRGEPFATSYSRRVSAILDRIEALQAPALGALPVAAPPPPQRDHGAARTLDVTATFEVKGVPLLRATGA